MLIDACRATSLGEIMSLSSRALNTLCAVLTALVLCAPARADFVLNAGESATFNFIFDSPVPSHDVVSVQSAFLVGLAAPPSDLELRIFSDLGGQGTSPLPATALDWPAGSNEPLGIAASAPAFLDGSFSAVFSVTSGGPVTFLDPIGLARVCDTDCETVVARTAGERVGAVPEPASWALIGLGLASLGALRRRAHKTR